MNLTDSFIYKQSVDVWIILAIYFSHNNNVVKIGPHKCLKSDRSSLNMQKYDEEILNNDSWFKF